MLEQIAGQTLMVAAAELTNRLSPVITDERARLKQFLLAIVPCGLAIATRGDNLQFLGVFADQAAANIVTWLETAEDPFKIGALMVKTGRLIVDAAAGVLMLNYDPTSTAAVYLLTQAGIQTFGLTEKTVKKAREHVPGFV